MVLRATGHGTRCSSHRPQHSSPHSVQIRSSGHRPQRVVLGRKASARGVRAIGLNTHRRLVDLFTALANRPRHIVRACHVWEMSIEKRIRPFSALVDRKTPQKRVFPTLDADRMQTVIHNADAIVAVFIGGRKREEQNPDRPHLG